MMPIYSKTEMFIAENLISNTSTQTISCTDTATQYRYSPTSAGAPYCMVRSVSLNITMQHRNIIHPRIKQ